MPDGSLVPRSQPNAMVESDKEAIQQVLQMVTKGKSMPLMEALCL